MNELDDLFSHELNYQLELDLREEYETLLNSDPDYHPWLDSLNSKKKE